jgi:hypothetical protein
VCFLYFLNAARLPPVRTRGRAAVGFSSLPIAPSPLHLRRGASRLFPDARRRVSADWRAESSFNGGPATRWRGSYAGKTPAFLVAGCFAGICGEVEAGEHL